MTRTTWMWLVILLTAAALAATFLVHPRFPVPLPESAGPPPTPFDWVGQLSLAAGDGVRGLREGPALQARFDEPWGVAVAPDGTRYVADAGDNNRIRRIAPDGTVATLAGGREGFADGIGEAAAFHTPSALALDGDGNLYVADTGNHAIRKVTPAGVVTTVAGTGEPGFRDGPAAQAQFNGPIGVAVDGTGRVYVADTYNDRIRVVSREGVVGTLAGGAFPGHADGTGADARFDTPTALAVDATGIVWVADLRNNAIRRVDAQGATTTLALAEGDPDTPWPGRPLSIAVTRDGNFYVGELHAGRVLQVMRDGRWRALAGHAPARRLARMAGVAVDADGAVHATDAGGHRVHRIAPARVGVAVVADAGPSPQDPMPATAGRWPLHPQDGWHEVVGTLGEVRGDYSGESRHHLHGGLDIRGDVGAEVLAIADGKVGSPSAAWGFDGLGEGLEVGPLDYIHMRVGRTPRGDSLDPQRFLRVEGEAPEQSPRIRVRRGTRFAVGDALGTINRMAHVHLAVGPAGYERNAIALGFTGFTDTYAPRIDGIALTDTLDQPLEDRQDGHLLVPRALSGVRIVVDAWDQVDRNLPRRRLGLHALGYQVLHADGTPLPGYESPRMTLDFQRLPSDDAVKVAYAPGSGITVHGSAVTRFKYSVTNTVRDGLWAEGTWQPGELPAGDYLLRVTAKDYSGNEAKARRDVKVRLH